AGRRCDRRSTRLGRSDDRSWSDCVGRSGLPGGLVHHARRADRGPDCGPFGGVGTWRGRASRDGELTKPTQGVGNCMPTTCCRRTRKSPRTGARGLVRFTAGSDLLSHAVSHTVPSAVAGLTSVFGMGTGVTLLL